MRTYEETIELANNMQATEIIDLHNLLREGIRHFFSRLCFGCSYTLPCELDIDVEGTFGINDSEKIKYLNCYEDDEGIVYFTIGDVYERNTVTKEIDDLTIDELVYLIQSIKQINRYIE